MYINSYTQRNNPFTLQGNTIFIFLIQTKNIIAFEATIKSNNIICSLYESVCKELYNWVKPQLKTEIICYK